MKQVTAYHVCSFGLYRAVQLSLVALECWVCNFDVIFDSFGHDISCLSTL
jgi:hypothetical protein